MAFFSNCYTYDSQLRRKRSTSATRDRPSRPSTDDKSAEDASSHKRSPSASPSSSAIVQEPHEPAPPLPTPLTAAPGFRSRTVVSTGLSGASPSSYDHSSTPVPFIRPTKRISPPLSTSLTIDVQNTKSADPGQSSAAKYPDHRSPSSSRVTPSPPSALRSYCNSSSANNTPVRLAELPLNSHSTSAPRRHVSALVSPSTARVEQQGPPSSHAVATALPLKASRSPTHKHSSETGPVPLPTPVTPSGGRTVQPEVKPLPASASGQSHSRSQSATNSPTYHPPGSGPSSAKSSAKRVPVPIIDRDVAGVASGARSPSASGKSNSTQEAATGKSQEKRPRNVLRKRSITGSNRRRESESAPTSDSEKKAKIHRPRAHSVAFSSSSRRHSTAQAFDISQPLPKKPVADIDLTPAREVLVAYQESHRDSFSQGRSLRNSGKIVAAGSEEDNNAGTLRSPWSSGCKSGRKGDGSADERDAGENRGTGLLRRFSGRRSGKDPSRQRNETKRSVSESAPEVSERKLAREMVAKRSATLPSDVCINVSPASGKSSGQGGRSDDAEGHVWEEDVGDWVGKYSRPPEPEEKSLSNSRRLWRLVKRLSSGSLKERYTPPLDPPPPVPPLPKDFSLKQRDLSSGGAGDIHAGSGSSPLLVASRPSAVNRPVAIGTAPQMGRSATTRSSSPCSETTKFFSRSRSSSSSSYGDAVVPPMPNIPTARIGKNAHEHQNNYNEKGEESVSVEPLSALASTPSSGDTSREVSPTIPAFEPRNAVNKFLLYKGKRPEILSSATSHFPDQEPVVPRIDQAKSTSKAPPIPQRNPRRPGHHGVSIPSLPLPVQQHSMPNVIAVQGTSESEGMEGVDSTRPNKEPDSGRTVPKARPRSISDGAIVIEPERYPSTAKSPLTFREMTTTQRQLTEQEKNAKWEDLLQRSDKAGGTLHVQSPIAGGLWSDRSSVALSETSDAY